MFLIKKRVVLFAGIWTIGRMSVQRNVGLWTGVAGAVVREVAELARVMGGLQDRVKGDGVRE